jgi:hypothetical protein
VAGATNAEEAFPKPIVENPKQEEAKPKDFPSVNLNFSMG